MRRSSVLLLALLIVCSAMAQKRDISKAPIDVKNVAGNVYMLTGAGGNIGFSAGPDGIVLIDDQFAPLSARIREAIQKVSTQPFRFVLNTHFHGDHTGGNATFAQLAPIVAQTNVRKRLESEIGQKDSETTVKSLPLLTYEDGVSIWINGEEVKVIHVPPSHTDGDSIVWFTKSNVVHMGDDFFNGRYPFIDLESGGHVDGYVAAIDKVVAMVPADAKVIPGHGALGTIADLKSFANMIRETTAIVRAGLKAGKTVEQMQQEKVLAKFDSFDGGFIKANDFIETIAKDSK